MALEYDLHLDKSFTQAELEGFIRGPGILPTVYASKRGDDYKEAYGILTKVSLGMRINLGVYDEDRGYLGVDTVVDTTLRILATGDFDALLIFNYESPVLLRRGGRLILEGTRGFWRPEMLLLVDTEYVMEEIPKL